MTQWVDNNLIQWVDNNDAQWGLAATLNQLWTDSDYIYVATSEGLKIFENDSTDEFAYVTYSGGFSTVWGNDDKIFAGTTNSGIKYLYKACISGAELISCLNDFSDLTYYSELTSNNITYIHGYEDTLGVVTESGVEIIKIGPQNYRSYTTMSGIKKCFMTSDKFYYFDDYTLYIIYNFYSDWSEADKKYVVGSGILDPNITINDIFVTEKTSENNVDNTIFLATSSGVYMIDEATDKCNIYYIE